MKSVNILPNRQGSCSVPSTAVPPLPELAIAGITPFTTIDFPGRLAAVLYTQGCDWRCRYCHNSHLWPFRPDTFSHGGFGRALDFLKTRQGLLDGVVFCGGEPTAHEALPAAMQAVKDLGFETALHTTGMYPDLLEAVLPQCDWVGMDVKAPFDRYETVTRAAESGTGPRKSLSLLLQSGVDHEVRTTVHPDLLTHGQILEIAGELSAMGVRRYALQAFRPTGCADRSLKNRMITQDLFPDDLRARLELLFDDFRLRL